MYLRDEYPRPQFRRDDWLMLNGEWEFEFDDAQSGIARRLHDGKISLNKKIVVPFCYQYEASRIGETEKHKTVWYRRTFDIDGARNKKGAILCFNGSDYITDVWVNGEHAVTHVGGYAPFKADVTKLLVRGENVIVVRCIDPDDPTIPRGKQSWKDKPFECWYTPSTGIWQSVWVEFFGADAIDTFTATPDIDTFSFEGEIATLYGAADELQIEVAFGGRTVKRESISLDGKRTRYKVSLTECDFVDESTFWSPENPNLYTVDLVLLSGGKKIDVAHTRLGMRKIAVNADGYITLNNGKLYQRLILDQGYWRDSGTTPPSHKALYDDILAAKAMGFNGARKHQKFEDPYFYYYADELGFLTWCEMPSAYNFCTAEIAAITAEWQSIVAAAQLFSSIVCYVPLNESWGVDKLLTDKNQQNFAASLYYTTKAIDSSRLISTNDGWENIEATDIISIHDYSFDGRNFKDKYRPENYDTMYLHNRRLMAEGHSYLGKPVLMTEFGGIAMKNHAVGDNWGYNKGATDVEDLYSRLASLVANIAECGFQGYCYTQLTDVQQEVNGLLTADREPKADFDRLKKIFDIQ